jgi:alcohol dehydrogenase
MRALTLTAPKEFAFVEQGEPDALAADEALVRIHQVGVCGTDVSGYLGKMPFIQYPRILGHELGVEVMAVGSAVTNARAGDLCSVEPYMNCGQCSPCKRGLSNCCESLQVLGVHCDGGLRRLIKLPARKLHPASDLGLEQLALVETLGIGCHAVNRSGLRVGETALVIGAGPIGLAVMEFVVAKGGKLHVIEPHERRREFVKSRHASAGIHDRMEPEDFMRSNDGKLADVVIDATGNAGSMGRAIEYAAFGGRVVYAGITTEPVPLNDPLFHRRELTLLATRNALPTDFPFIIDLIRQGVIDTKPWITHRMAFDEVPAKFPSLLEPGNSVVKAMIAMD